MDASLASRWSAISGDYNPIHVSAALARLFGFPGRVAHGMSVVHSMLLLEGAVPVAKGGLAVLRSVSMEVEFRRPVILPADLSVVTRPAAVGEESASHFSLYGNSDVDRRKPLIVGRLVWAPCS